MEQVYRFDYARFKIECAPSNWEAIYGGLLNAATLIKCAGEFEKSHKVNRLWYNAQAGLETWAVDIWGEWASVAWNLDRFWFNALTRLDVRATLWEADGDAVSALGQHLYRARCPYNVHLFNSRPSTKRMGRDRGGVGFALGSHKSDLRITCYKRAGEPVGLEHQMTGRYLARLKEDTVEACADLTLVKSMWAHLKYLVHEAGEARFSRALEGAGIGTYWPISGPLPEPELPPLQEGMPLGGEDDGYTVTLQYTGP